MIEILKALSETMSQSTISDFRKFVEQYPLGCAWYVLSDYCLDGPKNDGDAWTFSVLLNHDQDSNIKDCIKRNAPADLNEVDRILRERLASLDAGEEGIPLEEVLKELRNKLERLR